jgi:hypothetical protein
MTRVMTVVTNACDLYLVFLCHEGLILKKGGVLVKTLILGGISISTILFMLISGCGGEGPQEASQPAEQEKIKFVDVMPIQKQKEPLPLYLPIKVQPLPSILPVRSYHYL